MAAPVDADEIRLVIYGAEMGLQKANRIYRERLIAAGATETALFAFTVWAASAETANTFRSDPVVQKLQEREAAARSDAARRRASSQIDRRMAAIDAEVLRRWGFADYAELIVRAPDLASAMETQGRKELGW